jgi:hypothetical protein
VVQYSTEPGLFKLCGQNATYFIRNRLFQRGFQIYSVRVVCQWNGLGRGRAMEAKAMLVEGVNVGGHLLADGAGHGAVRHVLRLNVQPGVGCVAQAVRDRVFEKYSLKCVLFSPVRTVGQLKPSSVLIRGILLQSFEWHERSRVPMKKPHPFPSPPGPKPAEQ